MNKVTLKVMIPKPMVLLAFVVPMLLIAYRVGVESGSAEDGNCKSRLR